MWIPSLGGEILGVAWERRKVSGSRTHTDSYEVGLSVNGHLDFPVGGHVMSLWAVT